VLNGRVTCESGATAATGRAQDGGSPSAEARSPAECEIWGVLNVTPDSFSDGGSFVALDAAIEHGRQMMRDGASVIDVGGESSRPSGRTYGEVAGVSEADELARVLPVIDGLCWLGARVSIDTVKPKVAELALRAGALIVNDVSCGRSEDLLRVTAQAGAELVLMHNRGKGERSADNTRYGDVALDVRDELMRALERAVAAGIPAERVWFDPGIGFAKTAAQSATLLARTDVLVATGQRVLIGTSRKSFIAELSPLASGAAPSPQQRLGGSAASLSIGVLFGAHAVRVHDVLEMRQAAQVAARVRELRP
jgi:dihydropteroate synthase